MKYYRIEVYNTVLHVRWDDEGIKGNDGLTTLCSIYPRSKIKRISEKEWLGGKKIPETPKRLRKAQKKRK